MTKKKPYLSGFPMFFDFITVKLPQDKKEKSMREGVTNNGFGRFLKKVVL